MAEYGCELGLGVRLLIEGAFGLADDFGSLRLEDLGEFEDCTESRTLDTTFKQTDVRSIEAAFEGECFLGKTALSANCSERLSERSLWAGSWMNVAAGSLCQQPYAAMRAMCITSPA